MAKPQNFDLKKAIEWANSGNGEPVIASRNTQRRHESEFKPVAIPKNDPKALKEHLEKQAAIMERYRSH